MGIPRLRSNGKSHFISVFISNFYFGVKNICNSVSIFGKSLKAPINSSFMCTQLCVRSCVIYWAYWAYQRYRRHRTRALKLSHVRPSLNLGVAKRSSIDLAWMVVIWGGSNLAETVSYVKLIKFIITRSEHGNTHFIKGSRAVVQGQITLLKTTRTHHGLNCHLLVFYDGVLKRSALL
ncbi:hypothetical protein Y032_0498g2544 [Ancylostoma ceylanicum]|uniref:Uncharacterized protein n=1 Tax=Ancylostoma ceylanicum TaxID=53326 RepID=A0A016WTZ2_9BILA|nr:hypothetical protein Y032_0498g2544 [Ancylostoma ceylanicum]